MQWRRSFLESLGVFGWVLALALVALFAAQPPRPRPASAPATEFSAERALRHARVIAVDPHPAGTAALEKVRNYLIQELTALGIEHRLERITAVEGHSANSVENVLARIPGTNNTKSFVMTAHYDSVYSGPGAADDGSGTIAMLEVARALKAGPALRNDLVLVFTGDEESGQRGIRAFTRHPWGQNVGLVLGFEARGTGGPSYMFETSRENGWLIRELGRAGVPVRANSMMFDVHRRTPNTTDFGRIKELGYAGYNVAFVGGLARYHSQNDRPENLSPASIQHHGDYALGLARHFGSMPLGHVQAPDAVFFNTLGSQLVSYPASWSRPLAIVAAAFFLLAFGLGFSGKQLRLKGFLIGLGALLLAVLLTAAVTGLLWWTAYRQFGVYILYNDPVYALAFVAWTVALFLAVYAVVNRWARPLELTAGALTWWLVGLVGLEWQIPLGSYLAAWPLLSCSVGLLVWYRRPDRDSPVARTVTGMTLFAVPGLWFVGPGLQALWEMGGVMIGVPVMLLLVLGLGWVTPQMAFVVRVHRWCLPVVAGLTGTILFLVGLGTNGFSPAKPLLNSVSYHLDLDTSTAAWLSGDKLVDEWTAQFLGVAPRRVPLSEIFPGRKGTCWKAGAPVLPITPPTVELVADSTTNGVRQLKLHLTSIRKAPRLEVRVISPTEVLSGAVERQGIAGAKTGWTLNYNVLPRAGTFDLQLRVKPAGPLKLVVRETTFNLPEMPGMRPRPDHMIRRPNTLDWYESNALPGDFCYVTQTFLF